MIAVPYHLGRRDVEVGRGPTRIVHATGRPCEWIERITSTELDLDAVADVNTQLARAVRAHDGPPIVLAGNCNSCIGTLAGMIGPHATCGVIWFDAHGDFNTPETTVSGALEGMSLSIATGHCHHELRERIGLTPPIPEANVLLVATRSLDPEEEVRIACSDMSAIDLAELPAALAVLARRVDSIYLHIDLDVLDSGLSPGVNFSSPGGISPDALFGAVRIACATGKLGAAAIANFNPDRDREDRTLRIAQQLAAILGEASLR